MAASVTLAGQVLGWIFRIVLFFISAILVAFIVALLTFAVHKGVERLHVALLGPRPAKEHPNDDAEADPAAAESLLANNSSSTESADQPTDDVVAGGSSTAAPADATAAPKTSTEAEIDETMKPFVNVFAWTTLANVIVGFIFVMILVDQGGVEPSWNGVNYIWEVAVALLLVGVAIMTVFYAGWIVCILFQKCVGKSKPTEATATEASVELGDLPRADDEDQHPYIVEMEDGKSSPPPEYEATAKV